MINILYLNSLFHSVFREIRCQLDKMESVSNDSQAYRDCVSCKPGKKTSLPPLRYKLQDQMKQQISFLDLSNTEIAKRL